MTDDAKQLGYAGSGVITITGGSPIQVLMTSGSFSESVSPVYMNMLDIPATTDMRSRVLIDEGVKAVSASLSFDVNDSALELLTSSALMGRRKQFTIDIYDGDKGQRLEKCFMNSLSIQGSAGGLISCSLQAMSPVLPVTASDVLHSFIRDDEPYGYWYSGAADVREWSLNVTQDVAPMYTNDTGGSPLPRYLRVGLFMVSLEVTTYDQLQEHEEVIIATKNYQLLRGLTTAKGYSFGGVTEMGTYQHTFETSARASVGSDDSIILIS